MVNTVTIVSKSPKWGYSPYKWPKWLINGGDPNYLLSGMILQVGEDEISFLGAPASWQVQLLIFGSVIGGLGPNDLGFVHKGIPGIPNHRAPNHQLTSS